jgi:ribonucleoside-diphosphate reductase alpha subunit
MRITKRNGSIEELDLNKILNRVRKQSEGLKVDPDMIATKTIATLMDGVTSKEIDKQAAALAESYAILHPDYTYLAGRLALTALTKDVPYPDSPTKTWQLLSAHYKLSDRLLKPLSTMDSPIKGCDICEVIDNAFNEVVNGSKGHEFDYQGVRVMANQYSMLVGGNPVETPDLIRFRVAYYLGKNYGLNYVKQVFSYLRDGLFTFATPININSGLEQAQLASCFLIGLEEDSYEGIQKTQTEAGRISKNAGGIGMHISNLRAKGTKIESSGATAAGILPFAKLTEANANYWNQGGKRKGSYALYLEPWHADVFDFLELKSNQGLEANRCRDLFYAMWIPDLFMEEVEKDGLWYLFCPKECPGLSDVYGADFKQLYLRYVEEGKHRKVVKARDLWDAILHSQIEVGVPYLGAKDTVNEYSMQKNIGTIKSSNLCMEVTEFSGPDETAVCNLANINLDKWFDLRDSEKDKLVETVVRMLNVAIDLSYYPDEKTRKSNLSRRPLGIGVQGLAEYFLRCNVAFDSETAKVNNKAIFQHLYQSALFASNKLVEEGRYGTYLGWLGSPYSEGLDHSDLYGEGKNRTTIPVANSLLIALMPTVTTSQLLGNTESFEPITSNIYKRRGTVGEYTVVNRYLVKALEEHDLWTDDIRNKIIRDRGSVQHIEEIPDSIKELFKTVWEIKPKVLLDLAIGRQPYVDQAQSMNLFLNTPTKKELTAMHFYSWKGKLKTMMYYLRSGTALNSKKV